ncbi:Brain-specific angiogenesis inhibitor 1-associated protein 2-like protein 2 [Varanus komodoensis]|nr:Brain-specific angiogenesis inhibitor 1-associated protein 2-like protein 2 [Varanus komodoensis]
MEKSYRSTLSIYKRILEQFNPALEKLVYLGAKYMQAFHALSEAADVYFTEIQKIGEQALQSSTSQILGEILIQMSGTQMHLNRNLEVVLIGPINPWFCHVPNEVSSDSDSEEASEPVPSPSEAQTLHVDLLQHMEKNTKLDVQFINDSRQRYEREYQRRATVVEKCMSDLWRMERTRDRNIQQMKVENEMEAKENSNLSRVKENLRHLHAEMHAFVTESQEAAELEEKRRYRFLAEKHQLLSSTFLQFYTRAQTIIQTNAPLWKEQLEATRNPAQNFLSSSHSQGHPAGHLTPTHLEMPQRPLGDFSSVTAARSSSPFVQGASEIFPSLHPDPRRRGLPRTPSVGEIIQERDELQANGSLSTGQRSRSSSFGEQAAGRAEAEGKAEKSNSTLKVQAIASHAAGSNQTLLQFSLGDIVTVLIPESQNGWLYGKLDGTSMSGWFPEAFVKPLETAQDPVETVPRAFPLRSSHSIEEHLNRPSAPSAGDYRTNPSRSQSPNPSLALLGAGSRRSSTASAAGSTDAKKPPAGWEHPPELFPKGTNPFATVKLRPTVTNDRSAPIIR